jgi:hypothetical protein
VKITRYLFFAFAIVWSDNVYSQLLIGPTAGGQLSWVSFEEKGNKSYFDMRPHWGYHAGVALSFRVRKRFFLTSSFLYSTKGKSITGKQDPLLRHEVVYKYIDVPIVYSVDFKAKFGDNYEFKYFLGIGPNISYWLGGKGSLYTSDFHENQAPELDFEIVFDKDENEIADAEMGVEEPNRIQLGLNLAAGITLEPVPYQKFMFIARYELGHSFLSTESNGRFKNTYYQDDLRVRNQGFRLSLFYMIDIRTEERKKGKSTIRQKRMK